MVWLFSKPWNNRYYGSDHDNDTMGAHLLCYVIKIDHAGYLCH